VLGVLLLVVGLLGGGLAAWRLSSYDGKLTRTDAFAGLTDGRPAHAVAGARNILIIGSDSRDGTAYNPNDRSSTTATVAGERSDTVIVAHIPADHSKAYIISIPRDTYVFIPKSATSGQGGYKAKINAAYAWGGIPLVVQTVERFTGVRVDNVVKVDFNGFKAMTDALGGVDVTVDKTTTDPRSKRTFTAGVNHLDGAAALDFVRQRYGLPNGDFDRVRRQQVFIRALLSKATSSGTLSDPIKLDRFISASASSLTVDGDFSLTDFALQLRGLRSGDITFVTSPYSGTQTIDGQSVVVADKEKARSLYQAVDQDKVADWLKANPQKAPTSGR
jgi:LCP family protein required for cell wall assembly